MSVKAKIALSQLADGERIEAALNYLDKYKSDMNSFESKYDVSNFRLTTDKITQDDLTDDVKKLLTSSSYDDSYLRQKISIIQGTLDNKVDKCDLSLYRKVTSPITKNDLSIDLVQYIENIGDNFDDSKIWEKLNSLQLTKTDLNDSGCYDDLLSDFHNMLQTYNYNSTLADAINFLFQRSIDYYKSMDCRYINEDVQDIVDNNLVINEVNKVLNFGTLYPTNNNLQAVAI